MQSHCDRCGRRLWFKAVSTMIPGRVYCTRCAQHISVILSQSGLRYDNVISVRF